MRDPRFQIEDIASDYILIRDIGPWDVYPTITNAAERVVEMLKPILKDREQIRYIDSCGSEDVYLRIKDGKFVGFGIVPQEQRSNYVKPE